MMKSLYLSYRSAASIQTAEPPSVWIHLHDVGSNHKLKEDFKEHKFDHLFVYGDGPQCAPFKLYPSEEDSNTRRLSPAVYTHRRRLQDREASRQAAIASLPDPADGSSAASPWGAVHAALQRPSSGPRILSLRGGACRPLDPPASLGREGFSPEEVCASEDAMPVEAMHALLEERDICVVVAPDLPACPEGEAWQALSSDRFLVVTPGGTLYDTAKECPVALATEAPSHQPQMVTVGGREILVEPQAPGEEARPVRLGEAIIPSIYNNRESFNEQQQLGHLQLHGGVPYRKCSQGRFGYGHADPGFGYCADYAYPYTQSFKASGKEGGQDIGDKFHDMNFYPNQPTMRPDWQLPKYRPRINNGARWTNGSPYEVGRLFEDDTPGPLDLRVEKGLVDKQRYIPFSQGYVNSFDAMEQWHAMKYTEFENLGSQDPNPNAWHLSVQWDQDGQRPQAPAVKKSRFRLPGEYDDGTISAFRLWPYGAGAYGQVGMNLDPNLPGGARGDVKQHQLGAVKDNSGVYNKDDSSSDVWPVNAHETPDQPRDKNHLSAFETFLQAGNRYIPENYRQMHDAAMDKEQGEPSFFGHNLMHAGRGPMLWTYNEFKENREARHRQHYKVPDFYAPTIAPQRGPPGFNAKAGTFDPSRLQDLELQAPLVEEIDHSKVPLDKYDISQMRDRIRPEFKDPAQKDKLLKKYLTHWNQLGQHLGPSFTEMGQCSKKLARCSLEGYVPLDEDYYVVESDPKGQNLKLWLYDNRALLPQLADDIGRRDRALHSLQGVRRILMRNYGKSTIGSRMNRFIGLGYDPYVDRLVGLQSGSHWEKPWGWIGETEQAQKNEKIVVFSGGNYNKKEFDVTWDLWTMDRFIPMSRASLLEDRWACYMDWQMALPEIKKAEYTPKICQRNWDRNNERGTHYIPDGNLATPRGFSKFLNLTDVTDVVRGRKFNQPTVYPHEMQDQRLSGVGDARRYTAGMNYMHARPLRWRGFQQYVPDEWRARYPYYEGLENPYYPGSNSGGDSSVIRKFRLSEIVMDWRRMGNEVDENYQWAPNLYDAYGKVGNFEKLRSHSSPDPRNPQTWQLITSSDLFSHTIHNAGSEFPGLRGRDVRFWSRENRYKGPGHYDIDQPSAMPLEKLVIDPNGEAMGGPSGYKETIEAMKDETAYQGYHGRNALHANGIDMEDGSRFSSWKSPDQQYQAENWLEMDLNIRIPMNPHRGFSRYRGDIPLSMEHKDSKYLFDIQARWDTDDNVNEDKDRQMDFRLKQGDIRHSGNKSRFGNVIGSQWIEDMDDYKYGYASVDMMDLCPGPQDNIEFSGMTHIGDYYYVAMTVMGVAMDMDSGETMARAIHDDTQAVEVLHIPRVCNPMLGSPEDGEIPARVHEFLTYYMGNPMELDMDYNYPTFLLRFKTTELWNASTYDSKDFDFTWSPMGVVPMSWLGKAPTEYHSETTGYMGTDWPFHWLNINMPDMALQPTDCILKPWEPDVTALKHLDDDPADPKNYLNRWMHTSKDDFLVCHDRKTGNLWRFNHYNAWFGDLELSDRNKETEENNEKKNAFEESFDKHMLPERDAYLPFWKMFGEGDLAKKLSSEAYGTYDPMVAWSFIYPGSHHSRNLLCNFCHETSTLGYDAQSSMFMAGMKFNLAERLGEGYYAFCLQCPFAVLIGNSPPLSPNSVGGGRADYVPGAMVRKETNRHPFVLPKYSDVGGDETIPLAERPEKAEGDEKRLMSYRAFLDARRAQNVMEKSLKAFATEMDPEHRASAPGEWTPHDRRRLQASFKDAINKEAQLLHRAENKAKTAQKKTNKAQHELNALKAADKAKREAPPSVPLKWAPTVPPPADAPADALPPAGEGNVGYVTTNAKAAPKEEALGEDAVRAGNEEKWRSWPFLEVECFEYYYQYLVHNGISMDPLQGQAYDDADETKNPWYATSDVERWRMPRHCHPRSVTHDLWDDMGPPGDIPHGMQPNRCVGWQEVDCELYRSNASLECFAKRLDGKCYKAEASSPANCAKGSQCYWDWINELIGYSSFTLGSMDVRNAPRHQMPTAQPVYLRGPDAAPDARAAFVKESFAKNLRQAPGAKDAGRRLSPALRAGAVSRDAAPPLIQTSDAAPPPSGSRGRARASTYPYRNARRSIRNDGFSHLPVKSVTPGIHNVSPGDSSLPTIGPGPGHHSEGTTTDTKVAVQCLHQMKTKAGRTIGGDIEGAPSVVRLEISAEPTRDNYDTSKPLGYLHAWVHLNNNDLGTDPGQAMNTPHAWDHYLTPQDETSSYFHIDVVGNEDSYHVDEDEMNEQNARQQQEGILQEGTGIRPHELHDGNFNPVMGQNMSRQGFEKIVRNLPIYAGKNSFTPCVMLHENPAVTMKLAPLWMLDWYSFWPNGGDEFYRMSGVFSPGSPASLSHAFYHDKDGPKDSTGLQDISGHISGPDYEKAGQQAIKHAFGGNVPDSDGHGAHGNSLSRLDHLKAPHEVIDDGFETFTSRCYPMTDIGCYVGGGDPTGARPLEKLPFTSNIGPNMECSATFPDPITNFTADLGLAGKTVVFRTTLESLPFLELESVVFGGETFVQQMPTHNGTGGWVAAGVSQECEDEMNALENWWDLFGDQPFWSNRTEGQEE